MNTAPATTTTTTTTTTTSPESNASTEAARPSVTVDIWSDIVCPWCYIGKRRFERAVAELAGEIDIDVRYRPYQLDPSAPPGTNQPVFEAYAKKFGGPDQARMIIDRVTQTAAADGLEFRLDRAVRANTLLAHRLLWWAEQPGSPVAQADVKERLLRAYFVEGRDVGDPDVLADVVAELGVERDEVLGLLASDAGRAEVGAFLAEAGELGVSAVPTFVVNDQWAIPGAQDPETFVNVLRRLGEKMAAEAAAADRTCTDDACDT